MQTCPHALPPAHCQCTQPPMHAPMPSHTPSHMPALMHTLPPAHAPCPYALCPPICLSACTCMYVHKSAQHMRMPITSTCLPTYVYACHHAHIHMQTLARWMGH